MNLPESIIVVGDIEDWGPCDGETNDYLGHFSNSIYETEDRGEQ